MADEINLSGHLHKLIGVKSEQKLEDLLLLLWQTRKTGLSNSQKSSIHSLIYLPSPCDLDPILVCLRSLIRNCVHKNLEAGEALKLLPADLPLELQSMLLVLLQKHRSHWKGELSLELEAFLCTLCSSMHQVNVGFSAPLLPLPYSSSAECRPLLSLQADPVPHFNSASIGGPTPDIATCFPHLTLQSDIGPTEIQGVLPQVKSMTWTVENKGDRPTNRVAIITLKLHDYTKSPINEMEVKFQLTRDTLEAVLRSMSYISQQLSQFVRSSTKPLHKKQRQL